MRKKFRVYAFFQFSSFIALLIFAVSAILISLHAADNSDMSLQVALIDSFAFGLDTTIGTLVSIFDYLTLMFWINAWVVGLMILAIKNRNLFDSIFLIFVFIPLLANILALAAQFTLKTYDYTEDTVNKKIVEAEQRKIIEKEMEQMI